MDPVNIYLTQLAADLAVSDAGKQLLSTRPEPLKTFLGLDPAHATSGRLYARSNMMASYHGQIANIILPSVLGIRAQLTSYKPERQGHIQPHLSVLPRKQCTCADQGTTSYPRTDHRWDLYSVRPSLGVSRKYASDVKDRELHSVIACSREECQRMSSLIWGERSSAYWTDRIGTADVNPDTLDNDLLGSVRLPLLYKADRLDQSARITAGDTYVDAHAIFSSWQPCNASDVVYDPRPAISADFHPPLLSRSVKSYPSMNWREIVGLSTWAATHELMLTTFYVNQWPQVVRHTSSSLLRQRQNTVGRLQESAILNKLQADVSIRMENHKRRSRPDLLI